MPWTLISPPSFRREENRPAAEVELGSKPHSLFPPAGCVKVWARSTSVSCVYVAVVPLGVSSVNVALHLMSDRTSDCGTLGREDRS